MAKKKITRKELLKKDDEFISLSNRLYMYASSHTRQIKYAILGLIIILAAISGIGLYLRYLHTKAVAAYAIAYKNMTADLSPDKEKDTIKKKSIEELDNIIKQYGHTKIASLAIPQLAYIKFGQRKYDEAISLYKTYLEKEKSDSIYAPMAHFGLAAAYEAKGGYESAMFSLGRVYAQTGQIEISKKVFQDFINQFTESPFLPLAKEQLK